MLNKLKSVFFLLTPSCTRAFQECSSFLTNLTKERIKNDFHTASPLSVRHHARSVPSLASDRSGKHTPDTGRFGVSSLSHFSEAVPQPPGLPAQLTLPRGDFHRHHYQGQWTCKDIQQRPYTRNPLHAIYLTQIEQKASLAANFTGRKGYGHFKPPLVFSLPLPVQCLSTSTAAYKTTS